MDTFTQISLGAIAAHAVMGKRLGPAAFIVGGLGGLLPDLDVAFQSDADPLSGLIYHRHFTHSLLFVPFGALLTAAPFMLLKRFQGQFKWIYWAAFVGYLTHGPLDLLTSYGTQLFWPLTSRRFSLDWVSIVDPIYTLVLVTGIIAASWKVSARTSGVALLLATFYLFFGGVQHSRAVRLQQQIADSRGHLIDHKRMLPTLGNNLIWRSMYRSNGVAYVDEVRVPWLGEASTREGGSVSLVSRTRFIEMLSPHVEATKMQWALRNFDVWEWFADGFVTEAKASEFGAEGALLSLSDQRFSPLPDSTISFWAIGFDRVGNVIRFNMRPPRAETLKELWSRISNPERTAYRLRSEIRPAAQP